MLNINLNFSVFGIIRTSFQKEQITESSREELCRNIEELSEKGYCLYSYWDGDKTLQILAAVEEEYELAETVELLQSLFEAIGLTADVELGAACHELENLHLLGQKRDTERGKDPEPTRAVEERTDTKKGNAKQKSSIREVVAYIEAHCTDYDLSLDMIASQAQITPQYLCVKLKQEIGMSYKEYLTKLRIEEAKKLLMQEEISVNDVCQRVGYINVSYFIKIFQKYTGVTPTRYRAERQE